MVEVVRAAPVIPTGGLLQVRGVVSGVLAEQRPCPAIGAHDAIAVGADQGQQRGEGRGVGDGEEVTLSQQGGEGLVAASAACSGR